LRNHGFLVGGMAMILSIATLYAQKKTESWIDEPYTKWDQKEAAELFNNSAWAQAKSFRGQPASVSRTGAARRGEHGTVTDMGMGSSNSSKSLGTGGKATLGTDVQEFSFTARLFSAQPIRDAYVRMLQIMNHYDGLPLDRQHAFDQQLDRFLHADFGQQVVITLSYQTNDPVAQQNLNKWFDSQTADTLKQNAYLFSPTAGQLELVKYFPEQGGFGAEFVFPRLFKGEPILHPGAGKLRFQLTQAPMIHQIMYIDFDSSNMTYKDQFAY